MSGKINAFILPKNMDFLSERIFLSSLKPFHIFFFFWYRAYRIPVFDRKYSFSVYELTHKSYSWI